MQVKTEKILIFIAIISGFFIPRIPLLTIQNTYFDYDEGTYLLIARLINHGVLPYSDIFAVHPPLYYYALAGWLRIFGDNYISGRVFSLFLGVISIFLAYLTGRGLKGEKLGLAFALLIALDPLAIRMNTLVLHESMIEFFTLLSLWFLVRYLKSKRKKHAYLAVVVASLGTSAKFTIIPYLLAVFVFLLLYESTELRSLLLSSAETLTRKQEYIVPLTYLLWTMIAMAVVTLYPKEVTRIIASVPGIHPITKVGHVYTCVLFIFLWAFLTVYLLGLRYFQALKRAVKAFPGVIRHGAVLVSVVILSKAIVEIPLGLFVSSNYISQTYLAQSNRGYLFVGIFWILGNLISYIQKSSLELLSSYAPLFILIGMVVTAKVSGHRIKFSGEIKTLLLLNVIFYLILIPIIPDPRFIYPLLLVFYIYLLTGIVEIKKPKKKVLGIALALVVLLALVDAGIVYNYPRGLLRIPCAPHTKELREDLSSYIHKENLNGTYLSINPMDAYYLRLPVVPYLVDTFGLGYLRGYSLVNLTIKYHPDYIIYDTWMFSMMQSKPLRKVYGPLLDYTLQNGTLLFEESRGNGEIIALFSLKKPSFPWRFDTPDTTLRLYYDGDRLNIRFKGNTTIDGLRIEALNDTYELLLITNDGTYTGRIVPSRNSITLYVPNFTMVVAFNGVLMNNSSPIENGEFKSLNLCTSMECFMLSDNISVSGGRLYVTRYLQIRALKS